MTAETIIEKITALEDSEMQLFRFLLDRPAGAILTVETDIMLAKLLKSAGLAGLDEDTNIAVIPEDVRDAYRNDWTEEADARWRKRGWMYQCIEACKYLYGVMTWDILAKLFALRYPNAELDEIKELFSSTPDSLQWFTERGDRLVLNGFEKDGYYEILENQIQKDIPFYIPTKEEVEELYDQGSLISLESHRKLQEFIAEKFGCSLDTASLRIHELYEAVNSRVRLNDAVEAFASAEGGSYAFPSDEIQVKFIEMYIEMSRDCRIRDNRGHDYYEMAAIMAKQNRGPGREENKTAVRRVKIGRNDPCPCGSGRKYKNCCGRN